MVSVPLELQERILDCLHEDILTLKLCSFVCGAWRPTIKVHLFRKFRVLYDADATLLDFSYCSRFALEVLHLADYIHEVEIQDGCGVLTDLPITDDGTLEAPALCTILDHTRSLQIFSISAFSGGSFGRVRAWRSILENVRASLSSALDRSLDSLTHLFFHGFSFALADLDIFRGKQHLEYVGLEHTSFDHDDDEALPSPIPTDSSQVGRLHTLTFYFIFSDPSNGALVTAMSAVLADVSHIVNLRLGGIINASVLEALPLSWLTNLTHLGLELTNLNPTHPASPLSPAFAAKVPAFHALRTLELSLNIYPSADPHDLSGLEIILAKLFPPHRLDSIVTTVAAHGPPVYCAAVRRHYDFCRTRADVVKVRWEDGKRDYLQDVFPDLFTAGTMEVGNFRRLKWFSW
ncbi:hypothetical protein B0H17DRAFT_1209351 [Mycena rosella]|uniref:F-box domain-containing protein n=1 Tax=Mycena rosella TaxID=1033263 RepID=A0AAD7CYM7_MYCRO|nr:hypothetical protein B0H17DRAFT_1209351 [Mycena rosella]